MESGIEIGLTDRVLAGPALNQDLELVNGNVGGLPGQREVGPIGGHVDGVDYWVFELVVLVAAASVPR